MKKVMVTGAGGGIGSAITRQLAGKDGYLVTAVTSGKHKACYPDNVIPEKADLLRREEQEALLDRVKPDILIHLAWDLSGPGFLKSDSNIRWLETSLSLLQLFEGGTFLFAGSSAEYGEGQSCREADVCNPTSLYGSCKMAFERVAIPFCRDMGKRFVCTRFFSAYGPRDCRQGRAIPTAIQSFLADEPFACKAPNNLWDYVFIEDIGRAVDKILESDFDGVVNISSGQGVTMRKAFQTIARVVGKEQLLYFENEDTPGCALVGNNSTLLNVIGFDGFTRFEEGIKKTVSWWKGQLTETSGGRSVRI